MDEAAAAVRVDLRTPEIQTGYKPESPGRVFWITGLSGAGKTTLGLELHRRLLSQGRMAVLLDGDDLRDAISRDLGYSVEHRRQSAMRNARLCRLLAEQGADVVCATISLFHEVQRWNRENIARYCEVYLRVPLEELQRRNNKGVYTDSRNVSQSHVVGLDMPAEFPEAPDLTLDNFGSFSPSMGVDLILALDTAAANTNAAQPLRFKSKAESLEDLAPLLRGARVLPMVRFTIGQWLSNASGVISAVASEPWGQGRLIVRSSARSEDGVGSSEAGRYLSVPGVSGVEELTLAIGRVAESLGADITDEDQIFVQPLLERVAMSGVAFSRHPDGSPYFVINYDDDSGATDSVTSGTGVHLKTFLCFRSQVERSPAQLRRVIDLIVELESLLGCEALDVEFAFGRDGQLYLLQVRRLSTEAKDAALDRAAEIALEDIRRKTALLSRPHPYLHGNRTIFGVMPDWNPAEIIGVRPRPLSLSLYRELVTDAIWAYQRDNYGYQNLRSFPLLVSFHGLPYIDVRVSFNSFIPRDAGDGLAARLVNYYIDRLLSEPHLHDKVEFEIIFSCYTLDLPERLRKLGESGFSPADRDEFAGALRRLTNRIIHGENALWRGDRAKIDLLAGRLPKIGTAAIDRISRIYWLIEDCKRYGTLPFAGLARAGFIAVQMLQSLVSTGVLSSSEAALLMAGSDTVTARLSRDFAQLPKEEFLTRYGHLRPGTYDILSPRYDEAPDLYFDWTAERPAPPVTPRFALSAEQMFRADRLLREQGLETDAQSLIAFIQAGIEGREYAKFVFTRSLSEVLLLIRETGEKHGLTPEDCAFLDYEAIRRLYSESGSVRETLRESAARGRERYSVTRNIVLPPIITSPDDVVAFHLPPSRPNFITRKTVTAPVASLGDPPAALAGRILFVPSADPGFDWIFTREIKGFVTQFGGANSHMAIRASELEIPAVIGAGEELFRRWRSARKLCLDCTHQRVEVIT